MARNGLAHPPTSVANSPAARLLALEQEDARLSRRMHRDQVRRTEIQAEIRRLRCSLTAEGARLYDTLRSLR